MATPWEEAADWDRTFGLNYTDDSYRSQHNYYEPNSEWYGGPMRPIAYDISERPAYSEQQAWILYNEVNVTRIRDKPPEDEEPSMEQLQAEENDDFTATDACAVLEPTNSEGDEKKKKRRRRRKKKKKDNEEESEPPLTDGIQIQEIKSDALPDPMHIQEHDSKERIPKLPNLTDGIEIQEHDSDMRMPKLPETKEEKGDDDKSSLFGGDSREVTEDTCNEMERVMPKVENNDNDDNDDMDAVSMGEASDEDAGTFTKKKKKRRKKKRKLHWTTGNVLDTLLGRNGYAHHSNNFDVKAEPETFTEVERREMGHKWQKELAYLELHKFDMAQFK